MRSLAPPDGRPLAFEEEQFLFRVYSRLTRWLDELGHSERHERRRDADRHRAGMRYLEVLRMTVRATLVRANQGLVRKEGWNAFARARGAGRRMTAMGLDDLVQEGQLGLMVSIEKFDWRTGNRFSTFATRVVRRHIDRAIIEKEPLVYLPEHALMSLSRIREFSFRYREQHGRLPSHEEISAATGVTLETLAAIYEAGRRVAQPSEEDGAGGQPWPQNLDSMAVDALRILVSNEVEHIVLEALDSLDELERVVLSSRFGLRGQKEESQAEIAQRTSRSQQRIVQIESRALLKILIAAKLQGVDGGTSALCSSLAHLGAYGIEERDALILLRSWVEQSDRFRAPDYLAQRLDRLEGLGLSKAEIGQMLKQSPKNIRLSAAQRWRRDRSGAFPKASIVSKGRRNNGSQPGKTQNGCSGRR